MESGNGDRAPRRSAAVNGSPPSPARAGIAAPEAPGREREEAHGGPDRRCASYHLPWPETERSKSTPAAARKAPGWQTDQESGPAPLVPAGAYPGERVVDRNRTGNVFHRIRPYVEQRPAFIGVLL